MSSKERITFGDFQTPTSLAAETCDRLRRRCLRPASIVEPTCGIGNFLFEASRTFSTANSLLGADINQSYITQTADRFDDAGRSARIIQADFFRTDWAKTLAALPEPLLVVGNPPWVCNSRQGTIGAANLPTKANSNKMRGIDAMTGRSNFDISEWMISHLVEAVRDRVATIAMLCKTSVARRVLASAWKKDRPISRAAIYGIDSRAEFGVAVDACLLVIDLDSSAQRTLECSVYDDLSAKELAHSIGFRDARVTANAAYYDRWRSVLQGSPRPWRSGIKHDCAKVMELRGDATLLLNGYGEHVVLESDYVFPMLKSSGVVSNDPHTSDRWMLVPQRMVGENTGQIEERGPATWSYLQSHADRLKRRASSIYRGRPPFSVFGVGDYTFTPWKVAISGLYKQSRFTVVGPRAGKPVVFDDTCYFLPCANRSEAKRIASTLNDESAQQALSSLIFWDAKRPITAELLNRLDFEALGKDRYRAT
ncbi:MAG: hypothetical protein CMJ64_19505 [Planctomycetaceae bacterium]|nr:hypothetical protein [Planctomycetaceae bacterium]